MAKITMRQELFLREYMKLGVAADAWRKVYKTTTGPNTHRNAAVCAYNCLKKPHVRKRLAKLQEQVMKKADISVDKVLTDLQYAIDLSKTRGDAGGIINAANSQAKLVGLLRDRVETGGVGDFGDATSIEGILEIVSKEAGPEAAMALASMFGLKLPESQTSKQIKEAVLFIADPASDSVN